VGERHFLVQDYDQPWVRGRKYRILGGILVEDYEQPWVRDRKYRIWGVFWFLKKNVLSENVT
jgi:hypothetical protein